LLLPLGGSRELGGHKGYGLAVMVDILSGVLSGAVYGNLAERTGMTQRKIHNAGQPEAESEQRRRKDAIPLAPVLVAQCDEFARELGVARSSADQTRETANPR